MYLAHVKTMVQENFDNGSYVNAALSLQATIDAAVQADANKFYTYNNFVSNLTSDITIGGGPMARSIPGITNLMDGRSSYLLGLNDFTNAQPDISFQMMAMI